MDFSKELTGSDKKLEKLFKLDKIKTNKHMQEYFYLLEWNGYLAINRNSSTKIHVLEPMDVSGEFELFNNLLKVLQDNKKLIKENDRQIIYFIDDKNMFFFEYAFLKGKFMLVCDYYGYRMAGKSKFEETEILECLVKQARKSSFETGDILDEEEKKYVDQHGLDEFFRFCTDVYRDTWHYLRDKYRKLTNESDDRDHEPVAKKSRPSFDDK
jgi:hypothetical protein